MAFSDKIKLAKQNWADGKARLAVVIIVVTMVLAIGIVLLRMRRDNVATTGLGSAIYAGVPEISSIPGVGNPTREYAKLQEQQNAELAREAERKGTAAMPTIIRTTYIDSGFSTDLSSGATSGDGCSTEELVAAKTAGVQVAELRCRGCSLAALKAAGFSAGELAKAGFSAEELARSGFTVDELRQAGFSAKELIAAGISGEQLLQAGYNVAELREAGVTAEGLHAAGVDVAALVQGGFLPDELLKAGFTKQELATAGVNSSQDAKCEVRKLSQLRVRGVTEDELKKLSCSVEALKAAGFTAEELKRAGYSAAALKRAGFSAADLVKAGFSAADLKKAGFSAQDLKECGFSVAELKDAGYSAGELRRAGINAEELLAAGYQPSELKAAGYSAKELHTAGLSEDQLLKLGYTPGEVTRATGTKVAAVASGDAQSKSFSCKVSDLTKAKQQGIKAEQLRLSGCSISAMKAAGYTEAELNKANFSPAELASANIAANSKENMKNLLNTKVGDLEQLDDDRLNSTTKAAGQREATDQEEANLQKNISRLPLIDANISNEDKNEMLRVAESMMLNQANQLMSMWGTSPVQQYVAGIEVKKDDNQDTTVKGDKNSVNLAQNDILKAGTILYAQLNTAINSDENTPILATIVSGPLKNARVLGSFVRVDRKVLLNFSVLNVPHLASSITINAVAIDLNTARTAMADEVNNHYFLKYGSIAAAAFVSGLGEAFQKSGSQIETTSSGSVTTMPKLNLMQKGAVGLGNMAAQLEESLNNTVSQIQPTVKVHKNIGMGLLLMSDLIVPKIVK